LVGVENKKINIKIKTNTIIIIGTIIF